MTSIKTEHRDHLEQTFGARASFRKTERMLYGHDIAALPGIVKPLVGSTVPDGVVQPESEEELKDLLQWASERRIAVTPRSKATSGYGGVLPIKRGLVVDFYRMKQIIKIDPEALTATVQPRVVFEKLDTALAKQGLTLRCYPTSYPAATVGGWLAQGGGGIGSFESGWFRENVVSARVVAPDGQVRVFSGDELDLVSDTGGVAGFISEVTIKVQKKEKLTIVAVGNSTAEALQETIQAIVDEDLPVWSILFINPRMAQMKNQVPLRQHMEHPVEVRVNLPDMFIATIAFRSRDEKEVDAKLSQIIKRFEGVRLPDEIAHHEWENRFKIMAVKRLGPSLVPAEVVVPLENLSKALSEIEHKIKQPVVKEGIVIKKGRNNKPEVVILGLIPSDQRKFRFNFVFGLSLTIMKIAEKHGGRSYSTGLYYANKVNQVLGKERAERIRKLKKEVDPHNILNPGKVVSGGMLRTVMSLAAAFEWLIRPLGNSVVTEVGEKPKGVVKGIPGDVAWYSYACSQCGYCVDECDQFYGRGWESQSPRGKWYWLREFLEGREHWDQFMVDTMIACTTCELCNERCSVSLPIEPSWMKLRGQLINEEKRMTFPPFEIMAAAAVKEGDIWAGYRKDRSNWFPEELKERHGEGTKSKNVYFAGCTASYVEHDIGIASAKLMDSAGVDFTYLGDKESCCGTPLLAAGKWDVFAEILKKNISEVHAVGADTVITSCPACDMMWRHVYPTWAKKLGIEYNIACKHYSEVVGEKLASGELKFPSNGHKARKVTWHDSCHMGRVSGVYDPPRKLIESIPGVELVEMEHNREAAHCCGSVLTLLKDPPTAAELGNDRLQEAVEVGAEKVLALCPCCEFQLRVSAEAKKVPVEVVDLAHFAAESLGFELPDPNPEVQKQWKVFEAMIALMTPEGFADLMGTMWPELIDAMPFGMGPMMRAMGKVPGALNLMKPMFPMLFPKLLPKVMPKVMPVMLKRVSDAIPMPDYMLEQMPELMPKAMDNLMPHMIGDLVPLVTQPMIDYLRGKQK